MKKLKTRYLGIHVEPELYERVKEIAESTHDTVSRVCRQAIIERIMK
jgi:predicted transcriptional regulator